MILENSSLSRQIGQIFTTKSIDIILGFPSHVIFSLSKFYAIQKMFHPSPAVNCVRFQVILLNVMLTIKLSNINFDYAISFTKLNVSM